MQQQPALLTFTTRVCVPITQQQQQIIMGLAEQQLAVPTCSTQCVCTVYVHCSSCVCAQENGIPTSAAEAAEANNISTGGRDSPRSARKDHVCPKTNDLHDMSVCKISVERRRKGGVIRRVRGRGRRERDRKETNCELLLLLQEGE